MIQQEIKLTITYDAEAEEAGEYGYQATAYLEGKKIAFSYGGSRYYVIEDIAKKLNEAPELKGF